MFEDEDKALEAAYHEAAASRSIARARQIRKLFELLWQHSDVPLNTATLWDKLLFGLCTSDKKKKSAECKSERKKKKSKASKGEESQDYDYEKNVRQHCLVLRRALETHFAKAKTGWIIELPSADNGVGYQLSCVFLGPSADAAYAFWQPHLVGGRPVSTIHVEHLFFEDDNDGMVFRYYDCNAEHSKKAENELLVLHQRSGVRAVYPYASWGELRARDAITTWFDKRAHCRVEHFVTRQIEQDEPAWQRSLILLGGATSHRFIRRALKFYPNLDVSLEGRTRAILHRPNDDEKKRIGGLSEKQCKVTVADDKCILDFAAENNLVPAILTRIPNPFTSAAPITILNSEFGNAVRLLARAVTDEERLTRGLKTLGLEEQKLRPYFQFFCGVAINPDPHPIKPLAWREYVPPAGI